MLTKSGMHYHHSSTIRLYLPRKNGGRGILAIQDQLIPIRMYLKHIAKQDIPSTLCRKCSQAQESIQLMTSTCSIMAPRNYLERLNAMRKIYYQQLAMKSINICVSPHPCCKITVTNSFGDTPITNRVEARNRPYIALFDAEKNRAF